jgi:Ca2+-binding EF-hand superfamily protein
MRSKTRRDTFQVEEARAKKTGGHARKKDHRPPTQQQQLLPQAAAETDDMYISDDEDSFSADGEEDGFSDTEVAAVPPSNSFLSGTGVGDGVVDNSDLWNASTNSPSRYGDETLKSMQFQLDYGFMPRDFSVVDDTITTATPPQEPGMELLPDSGFLDVSNTKNRRKKKKGLLEPKDDALLVPKFTPHATSFKFSKSLGMKHKLDRQQLTYTTGNKSIDGGMDALKDQFLILSGLWKHSNRWEAVQRHSKSRYTGSDDSGDASSSGFSVSFVLMKKLSLMGDLDQYEQEVAFNLHQPFLLLDRLKEYKLPYPLFRQALLMVGLGTSLTQQEWMSVCTHFDITSEHTVPYSLFVQEFIKQVFRPQWKRLFQTTSGEGEGGSSSRRDGEVVTGHKKLDKNLSVLNKNWNSVLRKIQGAGISSKTGMNKFARSILKKWKALQSANSASSSRKGHETMLLLQAAQTIVAHKDRSGTTDDGEDFNVSAAAGKKYVMGDDWEVEDVLRVADAYISEDRLRDELECLHIGDDLSEKDMDRIMDLFDTGNKGQIPVRPFVLTALCGRPLVVSGLPGAEKWTTVTVGDFRMGTEQLTYHVGDPWSKFGSRVDIDPLSILGVYQSPPQLLLDPVLERALGILHEQINGFAMLQYLHQVCSSFLPSFLPAFLPACLPFRLPSSPLPLVRFPSFVLSIPILSRLPVLPAPSPPPFFSIYLFIQSVHIYLSRLTWQTRLWLALHPSMMKLAPQTFTLPRRPTLSRS